MRIPIKFYYILKTRAYRVVVNLEVLVLLCLSNTDGQQVMLRQFCNCSDCIIFQHKQLIQLLMRPKPFPVKALFLTNNTTTSSTSWA